MTTKKKYYAVAHGRSCGIYEDWPSAAAQVQGFAGARYKGFVSRQEAEQWLDDPVYRAEKRSQGGDNGKKTGYPEARPNALRIFTDGGCLGNPGPGGFGVVIKKEDEVQEYSGGFSLTTNNRMELMAALVALEKIGRCTLPIDLFSDSSYLVNGFRKGWVAKWRQNGWRTATGSKVINVDLWQRLLQFVESLDIRFFWIKGHAGYLENERCDNLAMAAAKRPGQPVDVGYEQVENGGKGGRQKAS